MRMKKRMVVTFGLAIMALVWANTVQAETYTVSQVRYHVKALAERLEFPGDKLADLMLNFDRASRNEWFKAQVKYRQIKGVFVFKAGKGGLVISFMEGDGLASFAGNMQAAPIYLRSWSVGAQAGGEAMWGLGLIMDLHSISDFGGDYHGKMQSATAGESSTYNWVTFSKTHDVGGVKAHDLFILTTGRGFSAGVAAERLTISRAW
jgi:hypothetical protein